MDEDRAARNERLFRQINEQIEQVQDPPARESVAEFVCECADPDCTQPLRLTIGEYERIRRDADRFVVVPGHEREDVERVVERHDDHVVVEKPI